jgi:prepilin-type N-terminal cleavage/methylation domain-containing protein
MRSHRGFSLVELLLALSACGVILTLSTGLIECIMRAEMRARKYVHVERTALRLASMFRNDVWQASEAAISSDDNKAGQVLRLTLAAGRSLEYRQQSGTIVRTLLDGEQVISRDSFAFPIEAEIQFEQTSPRLVLLCVTKPPAPTGSEPEALPHHAFAPPVHLEISARVARDGPFQRDSLEKEGHP